METFAIFATAIVKKLSVFKNPPVYKYHIHTLLHPCVSADCTTKPKHTTNYQGPFTLLTQTSPRALRQM